jgi:hypothetical protein
MCLSGSKPPAKTADPPAEPLVCEAPPPPPSNPPAATATCPANPTPAPPKKLLTIEWLFEEAWCSDLALVGGTTENWPEGEEVSIKVVKANPGTEVTSFSEPVNGNMFAHAWQVKNVLPAKKNGHYVEEQPVNAEAAGKTSPKPMKLRFVPALPKTHYSSGRAHFDLSAEDYVVKIESEIKFVKGWGAEVVKLGSSVASGTGGLLDGQLAFNGYRWMKIAGTSRKYWDGAAWQNLPAGFVLNDSNNFCVGFYKKDGKFVCQYGGEWPESFTDWDIATKQTTINKWRSTMNSTWSGKFSLKRKECLSSAEGCCKYATVADVKLTKKDSFEDGYLIFADGNIRSNDALFFLDEPRAAMPAHEFGHHLGNGDEYAGATSVDTSLNGDGAVNGIDADSIMGQNMTKVKKRHFRAICAHFASMVQTKTGQSYTYEAV